MTSPYNITQQDAIVALLGAALGTAGGYGLYKSVTPKENQSAGKGISSALLGGLSGGGLGLAGSKWYSTVGDAMRLESLTKRQNAVSDVQAKKDAIRAAQQGSK